MVISHGAHGVTFAAPLDEFQAQIMITTPVSDLRASALEPAARFEYEGPPREPSWRSIFDNHSPAASGATQTINAGGIAPSTTVGSPTVAPER